MKLSHKTVKAANQSAVKGHFWVHRRAGYSKAGRRGHLLTFLVFRMVATQVCFSITKC